MKKRLLLFSLTCLLGSPLIFGQNLPNGGFENWESRDLFNQPVSWSTNNVRAFMNGDLLPASQSEESAAGNYALMLLTTITASDTILGYAASNGDVIGGSLEGTLDITGGFPVSGDPDSLSFYMMCDLAENDSAVVLIYFKEAGTVIAQHLSYFAADVPSYQRYVIEIDDIGSVPDTAFIAMASSHPDRPKDGSWMLIDSLTLYIDGAVSNVIPNAGFEDWHTVRYTAPADWFTLDLFGAMFGGDTSVTLTGDAHSGNYAVRIENVRTYMPGEDGIQETVTGLIVPNIDLSEIGSVDIPYFNIDFNPSALTGYYKYAPAIDDTSTMYVAVYHEDVLVAENGTWLAPADDYTYFELPLTYAMTNDITRVAIVASSYWRFPPQEGDQPDLGSVLILDDLELVNPCDDMDEVTIEVTEATCETDAILDAGSWSSYVWSNAETTSMIEVNSSGTYRVTVTDNIGCETSDTVEYTMPNMDTCETGITVRNYTLNFDCYPNPSDGNFTIEFNSLTASPVNIEVLSVTGTVIYEKTVQTASSELKLQLDLSGRSKGMYLIKVSDMDRSMTQKLFIR